MKPERLTLGALHAQTDDGELNSEQMDGSWAPYPYLRCGRVILNGMNGLFLLRLSSELLVRVTEGPETPATPTQSPMTPAVP